MRQQGLASDGNGYAEAVLYYRSFPVPALLRPVLACWYTASSDGPHRLVPDACIDLVAVDDGSLWLCGPEKLGWDFDSTTFGCIEASGLGALAIDAGYSDQAHLTRECRAISGMTPGQLRRTYVPSFPDMSDPFNTTQRFDVSMVT